MNETRYGDWMQTFTGRQFYPLDPRPEEIFIEDIAHALSLMNRYGGHTLFPYPVGQHSVILSYLVDPQFSFLALMHDASEAYLCDIPRPVKYDLTNYTSIEDNLMKIISIKYKFVWPMPPEIKHADNRMLTTEKAQVLSPGPSWEKYTEDKYPPYDVIIKRQTPEESEKQFLERFKELTYGK